MHKYLTIYFNIAHIQLTSSNRSALASTCSYGGSAHDKRVRHALLLRQTLNSQLLYFLEY